MEKVDLRLDWATYEAAKYACEHWHYSRVMPAGKAVFCGAWEDGRYIGCVIVSRGANNNIGSEYGLDQNRVCELTRVALTDHQATVTKIVAIALRMLRRISPGLRLIVSYADPLQGHLGGIYQAGNWVYTGKSRPQREMILNGRHRHKRAIFAKYGTVSPEKLRKRGINIKYGPIEWKYKYLYPLDKAMRRQIESLRLPYPKADKATQDAPSFQDGKARCESEVSAPSEQVDPEAGRAPVREVEATETED